MDFVGDLAPAARRILESLSFEDDRGPIECDPRHDLRMNEVLPASAHLPNAFIGLPPSSRQIFRYKRLQRSAALRWLHASLECLEYSVGGLAEDVELQLLVCSVSDPHRRRILVAGQPRDDQFRQPSLAAHSVHDLDLLRAAGDRPTSQSRHARASS